MKQSLFLSEMKAMMRNKKLLIAILAVMVIPILYAGMFLFAFWDPYDHMEDLPIAVVNTDKGAVFEEEQLDLGDELVAKLKEDPEFDFHFLEDEEKALQALHDQEYYVLIKIPEDFSHNATTLLDESPQKLDLIYVPNESFNFLSAQMGETAMLMIESALEESIIETYAETMFEKITEVADGLQDASEGTEKLADGTAELTDGSHMLMDNLAELASKSIEFSEGVHSAHAGSIDLVEGSEALSSGLTQLHDGSSQLLDASKDVQQGSMELTTGINQVHDGLQAMNDNIPALLSGTKQVQDGLLLFETSFPEEMTKNMNKKIKQGTQAMNDGLDQLKTGIENGLRGENGMATQLTSGLSSGLSTELAAGLVKTVPNELAAQVAKQMTPQLIEQQTAQTTELFALMKEVGVPSDQIEAMQTVVMAKKPNEAAIEEELQEKIQAGLTQEITNKQTELASLIDSQIKEGIANGVNQAVDQTITEIQAGFATYKTTVAENLDQSLAGLESNIQSAIKQPLQQLQNGLTAIYDGQSALKNGAQTLAGGTRQLKSGANQLTAGQSMYVDNFLSFNQKLLSANQGAGTLASGMHELTSGIEQLSDASTQLSDGSDQLADGSISLADGTDELNDGVKELNDKMQEAADETGSVSSSAETYNMMANPVEVKNMKVNEVPNYGTGFAPYFLSLGLFVGALLLSIVYPLREPASTPKNAFQWFASKFAVLFGIGIVQALIAAGILLIGLGLEVQSTPLFILYAIITSLTFITLIQFFVTCFGDPGRFIAILILIMQLTTSAGTFPLELIPKSLQFFNAFLPMTYTVAGFKAVVSSGDFAVMWHNVWILLGFTALFVIGAMTYFIMAFKRKYRSFSDDETVVTN